MVSESEYSAQLPADLLEKFRALPEGNERIQMERRGIFYLVTVKGFEGKPPDRPIGNMFDANISELYAAQDILWEGTLFGQKVSFLKQNWPFAFKHFLIFPEFQNKLPQVIRRSDLVLATNLMRNPPFEEFRIAYGSLQGGASLNRLHFQAFALPEKTSTLEQAETAHLYTVGDISIEQLKDYPAYGLLFDGKDINHLSDVAYSYIKHLQENNLPHTVIFTPKGIYVIPLQKVPHLVLNGKRFLSFDGICFKIKCGQYG